MSKALPCAVSLPGPSHSIRPQILEVSPQNCPRSQCFSPHSHRHCLSSGPIFSARTVTILTPGLGLPALVFQSGSREAFCESNHVLLYKKSVPCWLPVAQGQVPASQHGIQRPHGLTWLPGLCPHQFVPSSINLSQTPGGRDRPWPGHSATWHILVGVHLEVCTLSAWLGWRFLKGEIVYHPGILQAQ